MPKELHTRVLRIALQLPAALAAKRSGGSHRALPRPAHLPALLRSRKPPPDAEALAESGGSEPGICSPQPARAGRPGAGEQLPGLGLRLRHPSRIPGRERTRFSPGCPARVRRQRHGAMEGRVAWLVGVRLARGFPGWPGGPASERSGGSTRCGLGVRPLLHPGMRTFPSTTEAAPL